MTADQYSSREKAVWFGALLLLFALFVIGVVAFGGKDDEPEEVRSADGVLTRVEADRLHVRRNRELGGRSEVGFVVRPEDRSRLNLPHLRVHASDELPTRIYYVRDGDRYVVRSAVDLPTPP
jgi:hypothetical protein